MKLDNFRLIVEVGKRRALWDSTMQLHLRKDAAAVQWQEVADIMDLDVSVCKKRFKGLRDGYRNEIRKIQQHRIENSNWPYFRAMEFLREIFDPDKLLTYSSIPFDINDACEDCEQTRLDDFVIDVDNDDSFDFDVMGDIFKCETSEHPAHNSGSDMSLINNNNNKQNFDMSLGLNRSEQASSPKLRTPPLRKAPPAKRSRRRKTSSSTDGPYINGHTINTKSTPVSASEPTAKDDPDYNFLVSLLPHVKSLSSLNNMKFRMEVSRMLMEMNQQEMQPAQRELENTGTLTLPKLTPAPTANYNSERGPEATKFNMSSPLNGSAFMSHSSLIECDVKIENEPLF